VWDETCEALACGITSLANLFEPDLVVIGGGVSRAGEQLLEPVRRLVAAESMHAPGVVRAALGETVGVVGAAAVAFERLPAGVANDPR